MTARFSKAVLAMSLILSVTGCAAKKEPSGACAAEMTFYDVSTGASWTGSDFFSDVDYEEFTVDGIPVLAVSPENSEEDNLPLFVFLHGATASKEEEEYLLSLVARQGYLAISFDLPGHGERKDGSRMFMEVIQEGMENLNTVLEYMHQVYGSDLENYGMGGFSIGGIIAYSYAMEGKYLPSILTPVGTVADWENLKYSDLLMTSYENSVRTEMDGNVEIQNQIIEKDNPYKDLDRLKDITVVISHGKDDTTFEYQWAEQTKEDLQDLGNMNVSLYLYEDTGHEFNTQFLNVMLKSLNEVLKGTEEVRM